MTATQQPTITRQPAHPDDELGDATGGGEFHLLVGGNTIGGTYWCPPGPQIQAGQQWVSYGPAGYSFGHATREDAEQAQLEAVAPVATEPGPDPAPEPTPLPVTWEQALAEAEKRGIKRCSDAAKTAVLCDASIQFAVGSGVSPRMVWEGAMRNGMTFKAFSRLAVDNPIACAELMWV
jgi:hypothetical protein